MMDELLRSAHEQLRAPLIALPMKLMKGTGSVPATRGHTQVSGLVLAFLPPSTHSTQRLSNNLMESAPSTTSTSSKFEALFDAALAKYTKRTGQDLRNHPIATTIDRCQSPDAILEIFQEQSRHFDEFRNGDPKLIKFLTPIVNGLHAISNNAVLSAGASLVSPTQFRILLSMYFNLEHLSLGISPCKTCLFWNWRPPLCACHILSGLLVIT
jgi:fungal STAND N-terminal Goodbye domain